MYLVQRHLHGNFEVMAAVMVGGMVPPLAIALASVRSSEINLLKKKENQQ